MSPTAGETLPVLGGHLKSCRPTFWGQNKQGFWYFARSRTHEIQVFSAKSREIPKKREIPRNPPEIFPNICRQNIFNTYLGY